MFSVWYVKLKRLSCRHTVRFSVPLFERQKTFHSVQFHTEMYASIMYSIQTEALKCVHTAFEQEVAHTNRPCDRSLNLKLIDRMRHSQRWGIKGRKPLYIYIYQKVYTHNKKQIKFFTLYVFSYLRYEIVTFVLWGDRRQETGGDILLA